tara:strand:- start:11807 stop:12013 length:207 start_codon:yes stop_codon:yes gene_type:complete
MGFLDFIEDYELRAFVGSIMLVGGLVCMWWCMYKYAVCQEEKNKVNVAPVRTYTIKNNRNEMIIINVY